MTESSTPTSRRRTLGARQALWLYAAMLTCFLAASSVPSPLYALYRSMWGFSPLTLTVVFASYAVAMLAALLVFGALSDFRGRRAVALAALVIEIVAMVVFWRADSVGTLIVARTLQGVATGIATSAIGAGLVDFDPDRGALINSVAPLIGLGVGGLGASILVQFAPAPTQLVFDVLLVAFALLLAGAVFLPETARPRPGGLASLWPSLSVPAAARPMLLRVLPVNTAAWALGGFYLSLGPTLARALTGNDAPLVGGTMIASFCVASGLAVATSRRLQAVRAVTMGSGALGVGILVTLAGVQWLGPVAALAGTMIAGAAFGCAFSGSLRALVPLAQADERAGLIAGFFVACYLAFSVPAVIAGLLTGRFGLHATALGYGLAAAALAFLALTLLLGAPHSSSVQARIATPASPREAT